MWQTPRKSSHADLTFDFYEHPSHIETSTKEGCDLCTLFSRGPWQHLERRPDGQMVAEPSQMYITVTHARLGNQRTYNPIKSTRDESWVFHLWGEHADIQQVFLPYFRTGLQTEGLSDHREWFLNPSNSETAFDCIKSWLSNCTQSHTLCQRKKSYLPTRVIDVGPPNGSQDPFLFESNGKIATYVALSYCWGVQRTFTTTPETLNARKAGFALTDLPKTQQDAVLASRKLGVRYLWVDALCIIQGDGADWQRESKMMGQVYRDALLVISALDASNSTAGLFYDRTTWLASGDMRNGVKGQMCIRENEELEHRLEANSLSQRAWALQERFVATAVLHFARQRLCWECRTGSYFEDGAQQMYHPFLKGFDTHSSLRFKKDTKVDVEMWYAVVEDYSRRALTYSCDRLAAIAGLANEFEEQGWCKEYIAGLWKEDLLRGLLWAHGPKSNGGEEQFAKWILDARFPSWSWASSNWNVHFSTGMSGAFQRFETAFDSDLAAAYVVLDNENKTATTVVGSISFKGRIALLSRDSLTSERVPEKLLDPVQTKYGKLDGHGELDRPTRHPCWMVRMGTWKYPRTYKTSFLLLEEVHEHQGRVKNHIDKSVLFAKNTTTATTHCRLLPRGKTSQSFRGLFQMHSWTQPRV